MIVRIALAGPAVDVAEDAEAQLRVGVEDLALRHVVTQVPGDERVILQRVLDQTAEALAPGRAGIGGEDVVGGRRERLEGVGHGSLLPGTRARTRLPPCSCSPGRPAGASPSARGTPRA